MRAFHLQFYGVEAAAIYTIYIALRDECLGVDALDDSENCYCLNFAAENQQNLYGLTCVPACAIENGATAVRIVVDSGRNLVPMA